MVGGHIDIFDFYGTLFHIIGFILNPKPKELHLDMFAIACMLLQVLMFVLFSSS